MSFWRPAAAAFAALSVAIVLGLANGALVRRAAELGIAVPVNETIVNAIKALEAAGARPEAALDEKALEAAAALHPRGESWGGE